MIEEFQALLQNKAVDWLKKKSVGEEKINAAGGIGWAHIKAIDGLFSYDHSGAAALILPVWGMRVDEDLIDMVAWHPQDPHFWWLRDGCGGMLGAYNYQMALMYRTPLKIAPTPFAWLQGGCAGSCLLRDDVIPCLRGLPEIETDEKTARKITEGLNKAFPFPQMKTV